MDTTGFQLRQILLERLIHFCGVTTTKYQLTYDLDAFGLLETKEESEHSFKLIFAVVLKCQS